MKNINHTDFVTGEPLFNDMQMTSSHHPLVLFFSLNPWKVCLKNLDLDMQVRDKVVAWSKQRIGICFLDIDQGYQS
jgi:hypothetical protein